MGYVDRGKVVSDFILIIVLFSLYHLVAMTFVLFKRDLVWRHI